MITLTVLLATGAAQVTATACPMGIADGGDSVVVHFGPIHALAHAGHHAAMPSRAHVRVVFHGGAAAPVDGAVVAGDGAAAVDGRSAAAADGGTASVRVDESGIERSAVHRVVDDGASRVSTAAPGAPVDTGVPCALTMQCAPLIPAPSAPPAVLADVADIFSPSLSTHLLSTEMDTTSPPPRLLA